VLASQAGSSSTGLGAGIFRAQPGVGIDSRLLDNITGKETIKMKLFSIGILAAAMGAPLSAFAGASEGLALLGFDEGSSAQYAETARDMSLLESIAPYSSLEDSDVTPGPDADGAIATKSKQEKNHAKAQGSKKAKARKDLTGRDHQGNHDSKTKPGVRGGAKGDKHDHGTKQNGHAGGSRKK
jgi:hypothetical protein